MSLTENSNQVFLPGGATNSQHSPLISVWPLDQYLISPFILISPLHAMCPSLCAYTVLLCACYDILFLSNIVQHGTKAQYYGLPPGSSHQCTTKYILAHQSRC